MVKHLLLVVMALSSLTTCGLFLPDDFPSYLPFVEGVFDLRAAMRTQGYTNPRVYEVVRGWLPRSRHGRDWAFVHVDIHGQGARRFGVMALDKRSMNLQDWRENGTVPPINQNPYLSESLNGWVSGTTEWQVNTGSLVLAPLPALTPPVQVSNAGRIWSEGGENFFLSNASYTALPGVLIHKTIHRYNNVWAPQSLVPRTFPLGFFHPFPSIFLLDIQPHGTSSFIVLGNLNGQGHAIGFTSLTQFQANQFAFSYHGFPLALDGDRGFTYITTDGPVVFQGGKLTRYAPENGARILDELSLPERFRPLGFSVDQKRWLGWDEGSGRVFLLRAWW